MFVSPAWFNFYRLSRVVTVVGTVGRRLAQSLPPHCKTRQPLWLTSTQGPSFFSSLLVVTLVVCKSWKVRMDLSQDPREGSLSFFGVDCYQGCWLCRYALLRYPFLTSPCQHVCVCCWLGNKLFSSFSIIDLCRPFAGALLYSPLKKDFSWGCATFFYM